MTPSPLERAILTRYYDAFSDQGFPSPDSIGVLARENSGAGRFVDLQAPLTSISQHACGLPDDIGIEMEGLANGLGFVLFIENGRLDMLEFHTYGEDWDGEERPWRFVTVASGARSANA